MASVSQGAINSAPQRRRNSWRLMPLILSIAVLATVFLAAVISLWWTPYDPIQVVLEQRLLGPSLTHWLGTDQVGIDIISQLMVGAQTSILVGLVAVLIAALGGIPLGVIAGMTGGWISQLIMRASDLLLAFPALLLAIILAAAFGGSTWTAMIAIGVSTIPAFARVTRSATRSIMTADFLAAAQMGGSSAFRRAVRHVLPNASGPILVQLSVSFGIAILAEAALSYLGLGTQPPTPTWGRMLRAAQSQVFTEPILALWPGLAIAATVLATNVLGDALRDLLDPRTRS